MRLRMVTFALTNGPLGDELSGLTHVQDAVSWFLLDLYRLPLPQVVQCRSLRLFGFLIGADRDNDFGRGLDQSDVYQVMNQAMATDQLQVFDLLVQCASLATFKWLTPTIEAAAQGKLAFLERIYNHRRAWCHPQALETAAQNGHLDCVKFLVHNQLVKFAFEATQSALLGDHRDIAKYLLEHCELKCMQCLLDKLLLRGRLVQAAWLHELDGGDNGTLRANKSRCCADHRESQTVSQRLQAYCHEMTTFRMDQLAYLRQHCPQVHKTALRKLLVETAQAGALHNVKWLYKQLDLTHDKQAIQQALQKAWVYGHVDVVKFFVEHGHALPNDALDVAVRLGYVAMVHFLQEECNITRLNDADKALERAAAAGHLELLQMFDAQRKERRPYPVEAFCGAALNGNLVMLQFLFKSTQTPCEPERLVLDALVDGVHGGHLEVVEFLHSERIKSGQHAEQDVELWRRLFDLAELSDFESCPGRATVLRFLISQVPKTTLQDQDTAWNLILLAVSMRDLELLKELHRRHAAAFDDWPMLDEVIWSGSLAMLRFFHENTQARFDSALMGLAAQRGLLHFVQFLHFNRNEGCTHRAMRSAAWHGHWKIVRFLHLHRTEGDLKDAIRAAIENSQLRVVQYLFSLENQRWDLCQILRSASVQSCLQVVQWLVVHLHHIEIKVYQTAIQECLEQREEDDDQKQLVVAFLKEQLG